jgi:cytochrome c553
MIRLSVLRAVSLAVASLWVATVPAIAMAQAPAAVKGDAAKARDKVAMCAGCHGIRGYKASFPEVYSVPMIAGQSERYLQAALEAYRKGDRPHPTMRAIAGSLTDQDIADIAAYYAAGGKTTVGSAK